MKKFPSTPTISLKNTKSILFPLALAALALLGGALPATAQVFWDGNGNSTWDTTTQNWKTLASGGNSTAFTTGGNVTFGVTSPTTQTVAVTSGGVSTGLFNINTGTAWNFSGGNITATNVTTTNTIAAATTFTDMSVNLAVSGGGNVAGVTLGANVTLTSSTAKTSTWSGPTYSFLINTGNTLTLGGNTTLDASKIGAKSGSLGTIIINDNAVLKGASFGASNNISALLQPIDLNGGTLTATTLTNKGGGVAISWSGGVIRPTTTAGISYGTNNSTVVNTIVLDGAGGGTFNGLNYTNNTASTITIDNAITESGGSRGVTLTGGGTLVLKGNNTYSGNTTVTAGTLMVDAGGSIGNSSAIMVSSGATIQNANGAAITRALTLSEGAALVTSAVTSSFAPTSLTLTGDASNGWTPIALTNSAGGGLVKSGTLTLTISGLSATTYNLTSGSGFSGAFNSPGSINGYTLTTADSGATFTGTGGGFNYTYTNLDNTLSVVAVPEPTTWALFAATLTVATVLRRRRNQ